MYFFRECMSFYNFNNKYVFWVVAGCCILCVFYVLFSFPFYLCTAVDVKPVFKSWSINKPSISYFNLCSLVVCGLLICGMNVQLYGHPTSLNVKLCIHLSSIIACPASFSLTCFIFFILYLTEV